MICSFLPRTALVKNGQNKSVSTCITCRVLVRSVRLEVACEKRGHVGETDVIDVHASLNYPYTSFQLQHCDACCMVQIFRSWTRIL